MTARDRLSHLEREMASLSALLRDKQNASPGSDQAGPGQINAAHTLDNEEDDEQDQADIADASTPSHLRLLFNDFAVGFHDYAGVESNANIGELHKRSMSVGRAKLGPLLPSREEVMRFAGFTSDWMTLYHTLFPAFFAFRTGEQLTINYDRMNDQGVHPVVLAMYLLSVAITAQQVPSESVPATLYRGRGVASFVDAVCRTVEQVVVKSDALLSTLEGLETAMLFVRL